MRYTEGMIAFGLAGRSPVVGGGTVARESVKLILDWIIAFQSFMHG